MMRPLSLMRRCAWWIATASLVVAGAIVGIARLGGPSPVDHSHSAGGDFDPETSCGPASLAVVSEYLGRPIPIVVFHEAAGAGDLGVCSVADLLRALRQHGFSAKAVRYRAGSAPGHRLPMVIFVDGNHFLVALPGPRGKVVIVDPPLEPSVVQWSQLAPRWHGEAVIVGLSDDDVRLALAGS